MKKLICFFCVLIGFAIILYPHILGKLNENTQKEVLEIAYAKEKLSKKLLVEIDRESLIMKKIDKQFEKGSKLIIQEASDTNDTIVKSDSVEKDKSVEIDSIAIIKIDKINLELPLLEGATKKNLSIAPCILKESTMIGEIGNFSVAGHRSYSYGKQFNRLNELEIDDEIKILMNGLEYEFEVTEKFIVEPEDVWVLDGNGNDKMITLMTCTPIKVATHRLIIRGLLK